jgi:predicted transcriptional regulator
MATTDVEPRCSFCGKGHSEVPRLVAAEVEGLAICEGVRGRRDAGARQAWVGAAMQVLARRGWVPPTVEIRFTVRSEP